MKFLSKYLVLLLVIFLIIPSRGSVVPAKAQSIPKPSLPEFTITYRDYSYSVPPTYGIDEYTGQNITISSGYDIINRTVLFAIKNQPFNGYYDSSGKYIQLYYHIRYKGSYGETWSDYSTAQGNSLVFQDTLVFPASTSSYSDLLIYHYSAAGGGVGGEARFSNINIPTTGKIDFQVQSLIGYGNIFNSNGIIGDFAVYYYNFTGQAGDWSPTQTLGMPEGSVSTSTNPSPTSIQALNPSPSTISPSPTVSEFSWLGIAPLLLSVFATAVMLRYRKPSSG
jgi:hypothetical protein